jgi:hypothetical protein
MRTYRKPKHKNTKERFRTGLCMNCATFAELIKFRRSYLCIECFLEYDAVYVQHRLDSLLRNGESSLSPIQEKK